MVLYVEEKKKKAKASFASLCEARFRIEGVKYGSHFKLKRLACRSALRSPAHPCAFGGAIGEPNPRGGVGGHEGEGGSILGRIVE